MGSDRHRTPRLRSKSSDTVLLCIIEVPQLSHHGPEHRDELLPVSLVVERKTGMDHRAMTATTKRYPVVEPIGPLRVDCLREDVVRLKGGYRLFEPAHHAFLVPEPADSRPLAQ